MVICRHAAHAGDKGYALQQENAHCIHDGVLHFLCRGEASLSKAA